MAQTDIPDAQKKIGTRDKDVPWYVPDIGEKLGQPARDLLENYSKFPADEVVDHVLKIRDEAWDIFPYPCIGGFRFLDLAIAQHPFYPTLLQRLKESNNTFLDLGCCFGQELRKVAYDGAPPQNLYGCDLRSEFFTLGYRLFRDSPSTLASKFIAADIFDSSPSSALAELEGKVDIIYAGSFLHLFDYEQQVTVCKRIVGLLKGKEGSCLLGRQVGHVDSGERVHNTNPSGKMYRHNKESFEQMWEEVGKETGTKWRVEAELRVTEDSTMKARRAVHGEGMRSLRFLVTRSE